MGVGVRTSSTKSSRVPGQDDRPEDSRGEGKNHRARKTLPSQSFGDPSALEKALFERPSPFPCPQSPSSAQDMVFLAAP